MGCYVCALIRDQGKRDAEWDRKMADNDAMVDCLLRAESVRGRDTMKVPLPDRPCWLCGTPVRDKTKVHQGRRLRWCSDACERTWLENHYWTSARAAAIRRDENQCNRCGRVGGSVIEEACVRCGAGWPCEPVRLLGYTQWPEDPPSRLYLPGHYRTAIVVEIEVNHIIPRVGAGYHEGCHHHVDRLEPLCHTCHVQVTMEQGRARRGIVAVDQAPLFAEDGVA